MKIILVATDFTEHSVRALSFAVVLGSVAESVVRTAEVPVVTVRAPDR